MGVGGAWAVAEAAEARWLDADDLEAAAGGVEAINLERGWHD